MELLDRYFATARERYWIKLRRERGDEPPWTTDPHLQAWRFCNVHREDDRTTAWFRENVRSKLTGMKVVEATVAFRWFNRIETAERILPQLLGRWDEKAVFSKLRGVSPVVTGAYIIKGWDGMPKLEGVMHCIHTARPILRKIVPTWDYSLQAAHASLLQIPYLGRFLAYELVSDLRWTDVLRQAWDIEDWASAGPGCARGLGRVVANDPGRFAYGTDQAKMLDVMRELLAYSRSAEYWPQEWPRWEMREVEHWSCEFDKYERASAGDRLKRRYP